MKSVSMSHLLLKSVWKISDIIYLFASMPQIHLNAVQINTVCEWWCLLTVFKEAMATIVHLMHQAMCDNMWLSLSVSISVWIHTPVNRVKLRKNGISSTLRPSGVCPSVCDGVLICLWMCGCGHPRRKINPETSECFQHLTHRPFVHQCVMVF